MGDIGFIDLGPSLGGKIGANPNINNNKEAISQLMADFLGTNASPETLSQERRRIISDGIREMFPDVSDENKNGFLDTGDLNSDQKDRWKQGEAYAESEKLSAAVEQQYRDEPPSPQERYLNAKTTAREQHIRNMQQLDQWARQRVDGNGNPYTPEDFRASIQAEMRGYQTRKEQVDADFRGDETANLDDWVKDPETGKKRKYNVVDYFDRNMLPEDKAVEAWYSLYDAATAGGELDFDKLEKMQEELLRSMNPQTRNYVMDRIAVYGNRGIRDEEGNLVELPFYEALDKAKDVTSPYWEIRDLTFDQLREKSGFLQDFNSYSDLSKWVEALRNGIRHDGVSDVVSPTEATQDHRLPREEGGRAAGQDEEG